MVERMRRRIGKRGQVLVVLGVIEIVLGYSFLVQPPRRAPGQFVIHDLIPTPWWAVIWIVGGSIAVVYSIARRGRDGVGFSSLYAPPALAALSYMASWMLHVFHHPGDAHGWVSAFLYSALVALVWIVSGWAEPYQRLPIHALIHGGRTEDARDT